MMQQQTLRYSLKDISMKEAIEMLKQYFKRNMEIIDELLKILTKIAVQKYLNEQMLPVACRLSMKLDIL